MTYVEFEILSALARSPGRVLSRQTLLECVWGDSEYRDPRTVDVHIRHLREKLEQNPKEPEFLFTVRGRRLPLQGMRRLHAHPARQQDHDDLARHRDRRPRSIIYVYVVHIAGISGAKRSAIPSGR